jgi:hypothetical protein
MNSTLFGRGTVVGIAISALILMFYGFLLMRNDPVSLAVALFISLVSFWGARYVFKVIRHIELNSRKRLGAELSLMASYIAPLGIVSVASYFVIPSHGWTFYACFYVAPMWAALAIHFKQEVFGD